MLQTFSVEMARDLLAKRIDPLLQQDRTLADKCQCLIAVIVDARVPLQLLLQRGPLRGRIGALRQDAACLADLVGKGSLLAGISLDTVDEATPLRIDDLEDPGEEQGQLCILIRS